MSEPPRCSRQLQGLGPVPVPGQEISDVDHIPILPQDVPLVDNFPTFEQEDPQMVSPRPREVDDYYSAEEMDPEPSAFRASQESSQNMPGSSSSADIGLAPYFFRPIVIPAGLEPLPSLRIPLPTFDGQTDPDRHLTQFLDACLENGVRNPHHLMQLFPTSLRGDAYDWYAGSELGSITTWSQLGRSFHDGFALIRQLEHALSELLNYTQ
eukprot:Gb_21026 [translate_table: standard]